VLENLCCESKWVVLFPVGVRNWKKKYNFNRMSNLNMFYSILLESKLTLELTLAIDQDQLTLSLIRPNSNA
jgi:hypothetical protein